MKYRLTTPSYTKIKGARNFFITGEGKVFKKTKRGMIELITGQDKQIGLRYDNGKNDRMYPAELFLCTFRDTKWFKLKYKNMDYPFNNYYIDGEANIYHRNNIQKIVCNRTDRASLKHSDGGYLSISYRKLFLRYYVYNTFNRPYMGDIDDYLIFDIDTQFQLNDQRDELDVRKMTLVRKDLLISHIGMKEYDDFGLKITKDYQTANRIYGFMVGPDSPSEPVSPNSKIMIRKPIAINMITGEFPESKLVNGNFYQKLSVIRFKKGDKSVADTYDDYWLTPEDLVSNNIKRD